MIVRPATDADIERVVFAMRAADAFEVYAERWDKQPGTLVRDLCSARSYAFCLFALCESLPLAPGQPEESPPLAPGQPEESPPLAPGQPDRSREAVAIALIAALPEAPGRAAVAMIATDEWPRIARAATRWVARKFIPVWLGSQRSAECRCWEGNHVSRRWLERLGVRLAAELPQHNEDGATFLLYRWINPKFEGQT